MSKRLSKEPDPQQDDDDMSKKQRPDSSGGIEKAKLRISLTAPCQVAKSHVRRLSKGSTSSRRNSLSKVVSER